MFADTLYMLEVLFFSEDANIYIRKSVQHASLISSIVECTSCYRIRVVISGELRRVLLFSGSTLERDN